MTIYHRALAILLFCATLFTGCTNTERVEIAELPTPAPTVAAKPTATPITIQLSEAAPPPQFQPQQSYKAVRDSGFRTVFKFEEDTRDESRIFRIRTKEWSIFWASGSDDSNSPNSLSVDVYNDKNRRVATVISSIGEGSGSVDMAGPGRFYFVARAENSIYSVEAAEYRPKPSKVFYEKPTTSLPVTSPRRGSPAQSFQNQPQVSAPAANSNSTSVWVNTRSGIYHYPGTRWFGKTKDGTYMSESEAKASGYRAAENGQ